MFAAGKQLEARYGRGFGEKNLRRMVQFAAVFPDAGIVAALLRQLGWTHFRFPAPRKEIASQRVPWPWAAAHHRWWSVDSSSPSSSWPLPFLTSVLSRPSRRIIL